MSSVTFALGTYPFGFALLCAARGGEFVAAAFAGIVVGSVFVDGGAFVTLAAIIVASSRLLVCALERRQKPTAPRAAKKAPVRGGGSDVSPERDGAGGARQTGGALLRFGFDEELPVRCALAAAGAIVIGGIGLLFHQNVWRAVAGMALSAVVAPLFCAAFSGFFNGPVRRSSGKRSPGQSASHGRTDGAETIDAQRTGAPDAANCKASGGTDAARDSSFGVVRSAADPDGAVNAELVRRRFRTAWAMSVLAVLFCTSWVLSGIGIGAVRVGAVFALLCSYAGAQFLPVTEAAFVSLVVSLPLDFAVIPAILLSTCVYAAVRRHFPVLAAAAAGASAIFLSLGGMGMTAASRYGGAILVAAALCVPISRSAAAFIERLPPRAAGRIRVLLGASYSAKSGASDLYEPSVRELRSLSDCFASLGKLAKNISRALASPSETQVRERIARAFDKHCASCAKQAQCRGKTDSADYRRALVRAIRRGDGASSVAVPPELARRCASLSAILRSVAPDVPSDDAPPAVFARDFTQLGSLLSDVSDKLGEQSAYDADASGRLRRELVLSGVFADEVSVASPRLRLTKIAGVDPAAFPSHTEAFGELVGKVLGCEMSEPKVAVRDGMLDVTLCAKEKYRVVMGKCSVSATNAPCGDSASAFVSRDGYFRALISDGMGSGTEAAFTAGTVTLFLERLLSAGVRMSAALRITNSFLRDRRIECSATVDVVEVDLVVGGANFFKSGAAPSFVLRGGKLFKIRSRTVPIGILPDADAEAISFDVRPGDVIVMTSDGVTRDSEDCPWLYDALCSERTDDLTAAARRIADEAKRRSPDDVTVMLLRVESA